MKRVEYEQVIAANWEAEVWSHLVNLQVLLLHSQELTAVGSYYILQSYC